MSAGPARARTARRPQRNERRPRRAAVQRSPRWLPLVAIALVAAAGGWWLFGRQDASSTPAGQGIASYRPSDIHALAVHPADPNVVVFGSHAGMLVSRDAGRTWTPLGPKGDAMGIAMPSGSRTAYAAGHDLLLRSDDSGQTWSSARAALPGTDIHGFAASSTKASRFYAFVVGHGLFRSEDAGSTWTPAGTAPGSTMSMTVASIGAQDVLFASTMEGVQRSRDGGATWERVPELAGASVSASGARAFAAAGSRVFVSTDGGMRWEQRPFPNGKAALVASAAGDAGTVYVLTESFSVWRSIDGGRTWERMS